MDMQYSSLESFSVATGMSVFVLDESGNTYFMSSVFKSLRNPLSSFIAIIKCRESEHEALKYGINQSKRFGGRYIFLAPSGLTYIASPLPMNLNSYFSLSMNFFTDNEINQDIFHFLQLPCSSP